jgi:hypothetical protein
MLFRLRSRGTVITGRLLFLLIFSVTGVSAGVYIIPSGDSLKIVVIRHGEKPVKGDNLNCQGLNRANLLPGILNKKFGIPDFCYIPSVGADSSTKHARMFQTITPMAVQFNLAINSRFNGKDAAGLAADLLKRRGTVLVVWDHKGIAPIIHALGIQDPSLIWRDDDFDSIWIINFYNGKAVLTIDSEGLHPAAECR